MSSIKKLIGFLLSVNLLWSGVNYFQDYFSNSIEVEFPEVEIEEKEIIYINGVKCYRPKKKP